MEPDTAMVLNHQPEVLLNSRPASTLCQWPRQGRNIWADVRINYILCGLTPMITIRVPVPWNERDTPEELK
jgi:hypothetical protein